MTLTSSNH